MELGYLNWYSLYILTKIIICLILLNFSYSLGPYNNIIKNFFP